jgi:hypothetical protein
VKKTETESSLGSQVISNTLESKDMLSKSFKNRDFPLMITKKKTVQDGDLKKNDGYLIKAERKDLVNDDKEIKETEKIKENDVNSKVKEVKESPDYIERDIKKGESLLLKELHILSEVQ